MIKKISLATTIASVLLLSAQPVLAAEIETKKLVNQPIVTEIVPYKVFYEAEEYHQNYFKRNPEQAYCQAVVAPKLVKFRDLFGDQLK